MNAKKKPLISAGIVSHAKNALPWYLVKCSCGHRSCDRHTVENRAVHGAFYQGCGWSLKDAQRICAILNAHWGERHV